MTLRECLLEQRSEVEISPAWESGIEFHKLSGILSYSLNLPKTATYKANWLRNSVFMNFLDQTPKELSSNSVILKGMHLIKDFYPDIGMRFMGDIDILTPKEDLINWEKYLLENGFKEQQELTWEANQFKRLYIKNNKGEDDLLSIELHTRLFFDESPKHLWPTMKSPYSNYNFLTHEALFVHLCGHLAYQHTFINLQWLFDIALLVKKANLDWKKVDELASKAKVRRSYRIVAVILSDYFNLEVDLKPGGCLRNLVKTLITTNFLERPHGSMLRYILVKMLCKDSFWMSLKYNLLWLKAYLFKPKSPQ